MEIVIQKQFRGVINFFAAALVLAAITSALSFGISLGAGYYLLIIICSLVLLFLSSKEKKKVNINIVFLILACFLSILLNDIPEYFSSLPRFSIFLMVLYIVGPFVNSGTLTYFRQFVFNLLVKINIAICSLSFLGLITGIYRGITINEFGNVRADFTGFYNHSMILGPMSGVAMLTCFYYIYNTQKKKNKIFYIACAVLSLLSAITAGSRAALVGIVFGSLFFLYKINQGRLGRYLSTLFIFVFLLAITFPLWQERTEFLMYKIESAQDSSLEFDSRTVKWQQRLDEFESSPVIGIGFASIDPNGQDYFDRETGIVEPGSSWLTMLSMTGIFGFLPIIGLFYKDFKYIYADKKNSVYSAYLGAILVLLTLHMIAEGYVFASGALMCFFLWLVLGIIEQHKLASE